MKGRKATPTSLKLLLGNPGKRAINKSEPEPPRGIPEMPEWLSVFPVAVAEWNREAKELDDMGVLTTADSGVLAMRAYLMSEIQALSLEIKEDKSLGYAQIKNLITEHRQLGSLMGLDPCSRTKLKTIEPKEINSIESFKNRKK